ncbi:hypothetical protein Ddye_028368 [Dipteronia dyeriana]|uniref:Uncharacterized protein n=1 Tax=Dipteronia dyeriana TaxID=168575 RepID=A0AAD9TRD5_9ROSI|nr:hypothetical protein Ddye_028368 [Dipteronia dyeriana]
MKTKYGEGELGGRTSIPRPVSHSIDGEDSSVTSVVIFSTLVAICGSFCTGCGSGYSSPAEAGIMEDLGLTVAEVSFHFSS